MHYDVAVIGSGPAALFCALTLKEHCRVALTPTKPRWETQVLWPGLTEHWGLLRGNLGSRQTQALIQLFQRSRELLLLENDVTKGAVLQLASNVTEFKEMTMELSWLSQMWPRRLMSAGAASNYVAVNEVAGAAFVADCLGFDEASLSHRLQEQLTISKQPCLAEITVDADPQASMFFDQYGAEFLCVAVGEPWNQALVGIETQRGHLHIRPHRRGWLVAGVGAEGVGSLQPEATFIVRLHQLAAQALTSLQGLEPQDIRPLVYRCSRDGLPVVGPLPGNPRKWLLGALSGRSWSLGPALGEQVALALLGQSTPLLEALPGLRPARFTLGAV